MKPLLEFAELLQYRNKSADAALRAEQAAALAPLCRAAGVPHVSLWASLPHYLSVSPNPRGTLALLLRLNQWLGLKVDTGPLERAAADFQAKINDAVNADPKLSAFVRELKKREFEQ